jgi:hypothetical protein
MNTNEATIDLEKNTPHAVIDTKPVESYPRSETTPVVDADFGEITERQSRKKERYCTTQRIQACVFPLSFPSSCNSVALEEETKNGLG